MNTEKIHDRHITEKKAYDIILGLEPLACRVKGGQVRVQTVCYSRKGSGRGRGSLPIGWHLISELGKVKGQPRKLNKGENYANALG